MSLPLKLLHMVDETCHVLRAGGVADLGSLVPLHAVVHHAIGNGSLPHAKLAPAIKIVGHKELQLLPCEVMVPCDKNGRAEHDTSR